MATKRIYLKDLHRMMDGMGIELAEKVHLLFMVVIKGLNKYKISKKI